MEEKKGKDLVVVGHEGLTEFCLGVFEKLGMTPEDAALAADAQVRCK